MRITDSRQFGAVSEKRLAEFERGLGVRLPEDYRRFLLKHNGGRPAPQNTVDFVEDGRPTASDVATLYGVHQGEDWASLAWNLDCYAGRIVPEGIPIASDSGGNQYVLLVRGANAGQVWFWNHECETEPASYENMSFVADSLSALLAQLYEAVDENETPVDRAIRRDDLPGLLRILDAGYDLETLDEYQRSAMENAAIKNRPAMIQALSDRGAELREALRYARQNYEFFPEHRASVELLEKLHAQREGNP